MIEETEIKGIEKDKENPSEETKNGTKTITASSSPEEIREGLLTVVTLVARRVIRTRTMFTRPFSAARAKFKLMILLVIFGISTVIGHLYFRDNAGDLDLLIVLVGMLLSCGAVWAVFSEKERHKLFIVGSLSCAMSLGLAVGDVEGGTLPTVLAIILGCLGMMVLYPSRLLARWNSRQRQRTISVPVAIMTFLFSWYWFHGFSLWSLIAIFAGVVTVFGLKTDMEVCQLLEDNGNIDPTAEWYTATALFLETLFIFPFALDFLRPGNSLRRVGG